MLAITIHFEFLRKIRAILSQKFNDIRRGLKSSLLKQKNIYQNQ